ncbi:MAG: PDZ domain-containing protein [Planctomycetia bacterium]|nr:PDZ domain-containing protein [Planctomycetia bacterium]
MIGRMLALAVILAGLWAATASAAELYVSPSGDDANPGTLEKPVATLPKAQELARAVAKPATVYLREGTYYLAAPLVFTADNSGTREAPVVWCGYQKEQPVISGGVRLKLDWKPYQKGIMQAQVPDDLVTDQLFVNGERQIMARYPNFNANERIFNGYAGDAFSPTRAARWADPRGGYMHAMHQAMWGGMHYRILGKDAQGKLRYEGGWQNNRPAGQHGAYRFVENIFEELDSPGEWFLNSTTHTLYFYPPTGLDLTKAVAEGVRLKHLIELRGTANHPVQYITFRGLTFRHAARTFMENKEPLLRTDWTTYRGGALFFTGTEDCTVQDCLLDQLGGNAVFVSNFNRRFTLRGSHIFKAGANGVAFVGDPQAVRSPLFNYGQRNQYARIDRTPGPKSANYPAECLVDDCLIHETGRVEKQTAPIEIDMAQDITVRHCSIYDVPRAGINIGDGCWGGHVIEDCDIFNTVLETGDHGSFNSWGRDRYWGLNGAPAGELSKLALLDAVQPNVLRNNRWRCDHGWDIDLDDGSSNYEIYNNLLLCGGLKLREGFHRHAYNNIVVNNSLHPHVWYRDSGDVVNHNIFMSAYRPAAMPGDLNKWGQEVDYNFFTTKEADRKAFASKGCDANSLSGDAMFVDPAGGDYRVKEGSPAMKLGFKNFAMDQFGVQKPELKVIAKEPSFGIGREATSRRDGRTRDWLGVKVKNIVGQGEISAYGTAGERGVLVVAIGDENPLAKAGLQKEDVILQVDGKATDSVQELLRIQKPARAKVWRKQMNVEIQF